MENRPDKKEQILVSGLIKLQKNLSIGFKQLRTPSQIRAFEGPLTDFVGIIIGNI